MKAPTDRAMRLRCPQCRTRRTDAHAMVLHRLQCERPVCECLRVPHPHRPGSYPLCAHRPMSDVLLAVLQGASDEQAAEIAAEIAFTQPGTRSVACPF